MVTFQGKISAQNDALVIFVDEKFRYEDKEQNISSVQKSKIDSFLKALKIKKINDEFYSFDISEKLKCFFVKTKNKKENNYSEEVGGRFFSFIKNFKNLSKIDIYLDSLNSDKNQLINFSSEFIHGLSLSSYSFDKYKTKKENKNKKEFKVISVLKKEIEKEYKYFESIQAGVFLTRDLVSEPPNVLNPKHYVQEIKKLSKLGLKIKIYDKIKMKTLGMNALLGVGQGSSNDSFLVTIEWNGAKNYNTQPFAFVGKGVCFDTGGISLKPARFMEEMKYDMAGSAVVVGLLKTFALRKAKINAVGIVGLVENMPGGNAQRPGDIVKSFSGKTIEVLNTDAEGRLVLADALSFAEKKFKPKFIIDLATLTGAIIVSLGEEYAGLFSNNDKLSNQIFKCGEYVNEKVWRLPLNKNYDRLMDSKIADVQNINYIGGAGSITAAQFLQRFILKNTPWVHLDIAGMAFSKKAANLNPGGATGFGVRLLNTLIRNNYE